MTTSSHVLRSVLRVALVGGAVAVLLLVAGREVERRRFGASDEVSLERVERELGNRFATVGQALTERTARVARLRPAIQAARTDVNAVKELFRALDEELDSTRGQSAGITIFDPAGAPLAWSGIVSDIARERIEGGARLFAAVDPLGPRLVRVDPLADPDHPSGPPLGRIVAEQLVEARAPASSTLANVFLVPTSLVDVLVRVRQGEDSVGSPYVFAVRSAEGNVLVEGEVAPQSLAAARSRWRTWTRFGAWMALALALLAAVPPIVEARRRTRTLRDRGIASLAILANIAGARLCVWIASTPFIGRSPTAPMALLPTALAALALVWLALDLIERRRLVRPRTPLRPSTRGRLAGIAAAHAAAAMTAVGVLLVYEQELRVIAAQSSLDLLQFSLHPLETVRLSVAFALLLFHAAAIWAATAVMRLPAVFQRTHRTVGSRVVTASAVAAGTAGALAAARLAQIPSPLAPLLAAIALSAAFALALSRPRGIARRASQAARLGALFLALLLPALAMYPSLTAFAVQTKERLVSTELALQAAQQREDLQARRLPHSLETIDAFPALTELVTSSSEGAAPTADRAFIVWSQTELASSRTTSAVELYGPNGGLVSWFALNLPEYGSTPYRAGQCDRWELYEETSPFGASRRNVLRASRGICSGNRRVGGVVVRAMLDYRALPFTSVENPYLDSLNPTRPSESAFTRDVEFAVYGWSRTTLYTSGTSVWPLADGVFDRMVASREAFWAPVTRAGDRYRVYFFNDRNGIYALGYPVTTVLGHFVNLGELIFLCGVLYAALLVGSTLLTALTSGTPAGGRALVRELRSSFYRKLFFAFVASTVVPVTVLALVAQRYFTEQFRAGVEEAAVKTATTAQRLVEDYAALQQRGTGALELIDDQVMVLVRRAIDQDVNLFDRDRLQATSERPLFASKLLSSRTPGNVYRAIALDRLPTSVGVEEVGGLPYLLAAAPVRAGGREGIVTVPQPLRSRDIEEQSDELDRRVLSASVLFVLLGSAIGYWMAERIADPVNRLTRATRRIARGDLDARIAATSSDELRRLVEDFNRMADDLKHQRADLERTQRLEAWADMARQVAHDIKNPLTPIQLSAEHAQRVNLDRGRPLSPVLDECVAAILSQVRLLRQLSAEFSSFASSPVARPEPARIPELIEEVVEPYRAGLAGRIAIAVSADSEAPAAIVDRTLFGRALTNVIENALHAMPGTGALAIATRWDAGDRPAVVVEVRDTGVGMDQEALGRIFEPYFSTKASGTGLGLTIAKRNIELSGGTIAVQSQKGVGTTVTMRLTPA